MDIDSASANKQPDTSRRPRVLVVGAGFAGLAVIRGLRHATVDITVIDRTNHHLFQPLVYQVATGLLSPGEIAPALRKVLRRQRNATVLLAETADVDLAGQYIEVLELGGTTTRIGYDYLVVAAGSLDSYFGHDDWAEHLYPMKTLAEAIRLRDQILCACERAAECDDPAEQARWKRCSARSRTACAPTHPSATGRDGRRIPARCHADAVDPDGITVKRHDGRAERIDTHTVIWAAGVQASPLAATLGQAAGIDLDPKGRMPVRPDSSLPGHPEVFVVGDMANLADLPGLSEPAIQEGRYVAKVLRHIAAGRPAPGPFRYRDLGTMATITPKDAIADIFGLKLHGPAGKLALATVHIAFLVGWGNRVGVLARWAFLLGSRTRPERAILTTVHDNSSRPRHSPAQQAIARPIVPPAAARSVNHP